MTIGDDLAAALPELRAMAESLMRDTIRVERVVGVDESTGEATYETVYPVEQTPDRWRRGDGGIGKVQAYEAQEATPEVAGATIAVQRYAVHIPVGSCKPEIGLRVTILAAALDPNLTGRTYRVVALLHKTAATAYRLGVEEVPS